MYFIPRNNKFYSWAAHIKSTHRYVLTGLLTTGLLFGWWFFIYIPLEESINLYQKQIDTMHNQYMHMKKTLYSSIGFQQSIKDLQATVQSYCIDCDEQQQDQLSQLLGYVEKSGLDLKIYNVLKSKDKDWYMCDTSHCVFAGNIMQFMDFLQILQKSKQLVTCENISLNHTNDELFNISCDMQFFTVKKAL